MAYSFSVGYGRVDKPLFALLAGGRLLFAALH